MITRKRDKNPYSYQDVLDRAYEVFQYDKEKALTWYLAPNPKYQNMRPYDMCKNGKAHTVIKDLDHF